MGIKCQILLDAPKEVIYKSGGSVTGTLTFSLDKEMTFNVINLRFEGKGKCSWQETSQNSSRFFIGEEDYLLSVMPIMETSQSKAEAGEYNYPFTFFLPVDLPSSFKDNTCSIVYNIIAEFGKPGLLGNKVFETEITVYGYVEPYSEQPLTFGLTKIPFSLTSKKAINMSIEIEKTFLTPGENIQLKCTIDNQTNLPVAGIKTKLITAITYTANERSTQTIRKAIKESVVKSSGAKENQVTNITYTVPTLPNLFSIQHSQLLKREYIVHVTAILPFPHRNASAEVPVVIGEKRK